MMTKGHLIRMLGLSVNLSGSKVKCFCFQSPMIRHRTTSPTSPDNDSTSSIPTHSSRTLTITVHEGTAREVPPNLPAPLLLREGNHQLQGESPAGRAVTWSEDVVDNEHLNKKRSNVCCIFKKQCEHEAMNAYEQQ